MINPLVSIIIPTYNRAHLIGETLDSVLAQTYSNWECIVVDDGSTDSTGELLNDYCNKDIRFNYYYRPKDRPKGANACRNYGFELSKGDYVNWFDSDDLMDRNKIKIKIELISQSNYDFVISKSINFDFGGNETPLTQTFVNEVTVKDFIFQKVSWCTYDALIKRSIVKGIRFNEDLKSGQEYNYFAKMLTISNYCCFIDKILTKRRVHKNSIQENQKKNEKIYTLNKFKVYLLTYKDLKSKIDDISSNHLLNMAMSKAFEIIGDKEKVPYFKLLLKSVYNMKGVKCLCIYLISLFFSFLFRKGYKLMNYSRGLI